MFYLIGLSEQNTPGVHLGNLRSCPRETASKRNVKMSDFCHILKVTAALEVDCQLYSQLLNMF